MQFSDSSAPSESESCMPASRTVRTDLGQKLKKLDIVLKVTDDFGVNLESFSKLKHRIEDESFVHFVPENTSQF